MEDKFKIIYEYGEQEKGLIPKVAGSNPVLATKQAQGLAKFASPFFIPQRTVQRRKEYRYRERTAARGILMSIIGIIDQIPKMWER